MGGSFLPDAVPNVPEHSLSASVLSIAFLVKLHIFFLYLSSQLLTISLLKIQRARSMSWVECYAVLKFPLRNKLVHYFLIEP